VPRFAPCRCAVTCRRTLNPVAEIMPDRCTPEYERTVANSLLPYRRARTLLAEFLPHGSYGIFSLLQWTVEVNFEFNCYPMLSPVFRTCRARDEPARRRRLLGNVLPRAR
jgi:hypothetical protein